MSRYDNYPDDIRNYDHDPRSPFFKEPPEPHCGDCRFFDPQSDLCNLKAEELLDDEMDQASVEADYESCEQFEPTLSSPDW